MVDLIEDVIGFRMSGNEMVVLALYTLNTDLNTETIVVIVVAVCVVLYWGLDR